MTSTAVEMSFAEQTDIRAAAVRARRMYPGEIGELVYRELLAYADFGHRFARDALIPDLAARILTEARSPRVRGS
ncbi:hypothetical protein [Pseudonocardia xishanensis]|uniref:Uncharacterized protein n=1 Tax=Pseudonocardia xishanensis TaxID=630995 RepID=A0ABP8RQY1_9PSEU